jgi:hypothetical protein
MEKDQGREITPPDGLLVIGHGMGGHPAYFVTREWAENARSGDPATAAPMRHLDGTPVAQGERMRCGTCGLDMQFLRLDWIVWPDETPAGLAARRRTKFRYAFGEGVEHVLRHEPGGVLERTDEAFSKWFDPLLAELFVSSPRFPKLVVSVDPAKIDEAIRDAVRNSPPMHIVDGSRATEILLDSLTGVPVDMPTFTANALGAGLANIEHLPAEDLDLAAAAIRAEQVRRMPAETPPEADTEYPPTMVTLPLPDRIGGPVRELAKLTEDTLEGFRAPIPGLDPRSESFAKIHREQVANFAQNAAKLLDKWLSLTDKRCERCLFALDVLGNCFTCGWVFSMSRIATGMEQNPAEYATTCIEIQFRLNDEPLPPGYRLARDAKANPEMAAELERVRAAHVPCEAPGCAFCDPDQKKRRPDTSSLLIP